MKIRIFIIVFLTNFFAETRASGVKRNFAAWRKEKRQDDDCCEEDNCSDYRGSLSKTTSGKTCVAWKLDHYYPNKYPQAGLDSNYCRNPNSHEKAWCYITNIKNKDGKKKWENCELPKCGGSSSSDSPLHLEIMTYNIQQIPSFGGLYSTDQENRMTQLVKALKGLETKPDVIAFQELFTAPDYGRLSDDLKEFYPHRSKLLGAECSGSNYCSTGKEEHSSQDGKCPPPGWKTLTGNCRPLIVSDALTAKPLVSMPTVEQLRGNLQISGGVVIFSKFPIVESHGLIFKSFNETTIDGLSNRGALLVKIELDNNRQRRAANGQPKSVWVMGLHLQSDTGSSFWTQRTREAQAKEVDSWIEQGLFHIKNDEPVFVAGDFNVPFKLQPKALRDLSEKLKIVVPNVTMSLGGSYSTKYNVLAKALEFPTEYDDILDYVGYRQDYLQPTQMSQKIVHLKGENSWSWDKLKQLIPNGLYNDISDHFPVVAEVIFGR